MLLKIAKYVGVFLLSFIAFVALYYLASISCKHITTNDDYVSPDDGIELFVVSNGVHADICLPINSNKELWLKYFNPKDFVTLTKEPKYISFGWGDKGFFLDTPTWDDLTFGTAFKALFIPSATAMHVSYVEDKPKLSATTKSFKVSSKALKRIEEYILKYIQLKDEKPILIDCCRYPNLHDNFYESTGSYHLFRTCNVWTNQVIIEGGVKTSVWTPFDTGILEQFEEE